MGDEEKGKVRDLFEAGSAPTICMTPSSRVDLEAGIIYDVAVLNRKSINSNYGRREGREYEDQALDDSVQIFEGGAVYCDHDFNVKQKGGVRNLKEQVGWLEGMHRVPDGSKAKKFHVMPDQMWVAQRAAKNAKIFGLSPNVKGFTYLRKDGVESVTRLVKTGRESVDLVSATGSTKNLFESVQNKEENDMDWEKITLKDILENAPDHAETIRQEALKSDEAGKELVVLRQKLKDTEKQLTESNRKIDEFSVAEELRKKDEKVMSLLEASTLPKEAKTETFINSLKEAKDEATMKALIEDRSQFLKNTRLAKPFSPERKPPGVGGKEPVTDDQYEAAIRG